MGALLDRDSIPELLRQELLRAGVDAWRDGGWVRMGDGACAFCGDAYVLAHNDARVTVQLDVGLVSPELFGRTLWQGFIGVGADFEAAQAAAVAQFLQFSFGPLVAVFAGGPAAQAAWRRWSSVDGDWDVCISPMLLRASAAIAPVPLADVFGELQAAFLTGALREPHWAELSFAFVDGQPTALDITLDGDHWAEGAEILRGWRYRPTARLVSGRIFAIAAPDEPLSGGLTIMRRERAWAA